MNRLYIKKSSITPFWLKNQEEYPRLRIKEEYPFKEIKSIRIKEDKDNNGSTCYKAEIILNSDEIILNSGEIILKSGELPTIVISKKLTEVENICHHIQQFLHDALPDRFDPPPQIEPALKVHQDAEPSLVFAGKHSTYTTENRSVETMLDSHLRYHQDLLDLGFKFLGDLQFQKTSILWCYAHTEANIYAIIYDIAFMPPVIDFYSVFSNGASLTTSTAKSWIKDIPERKIYRSFYPGASTQELYKHHSQRLIALTPKLGSTRSTGDLCDLAISIDDYRSREPSGLNHKILLYLQPIWSWLKF